MRLKPFRWSRVEHDQVQAEPIQARHDFFRRFGRQLVKETVPIADGEDLTGARNDAGGTILAHSHFGDPRAFTGDCLRRDEHSRWQTNLRAYRGEAGRALTVKLKREQSGCSQQQEGREATSGLTP